MQEILELDKFDKTNSNSTRTKKNTIKTKQQQRHSKAATTASWKGEDQLLEEERRSFRDRMILLKFGLIEIEFMDYLCLEFKF